MTFLTLLSIQQLNNFVINVYVKNNLNNLIGQIIENEVKNIFPMLHNIKQFAVILK